MDFVHIRKWTLVLDLRASTLTRETGKIRSKQ